MARRTSRCSPINAFSGRASGVAGDRGDDLAGVKRSKRSDVSEAAVSSSSGLFHAQREGRKVRDPRSRDRTAADDRRLAGLPTCRLAGLPADRVFGFSR